ncbi:MAG: hypothetical protein GY757_43300 [bacterium]|nr:hypothetical protein [bacterium]
MKLFTVGDSVSQGFLSCAAARTDLCYSTLIARAMGLAPGSNNHRGIDYFYPEWKKGGLPADLEAILRRLNQRYGHEIKKRNWPTVLSSINRVIDESEDYYERGNGREDKKYHGSVPFFHNVACWTFNVADTWLLTPDVCRQEIRRRLISSGDGWMTVANASQYRTALKILDPNLDNNFSQLDWLRHHAANDGVENLILWLGGNNALITALMLLIKETENNPANRPHKMSHRRRKKSGWNLWHPGDFEAEYHELMDKVDFILANNLAPDWKVFVGTVPLLSLAPVLAGVGSRLYFPGKGSYYEYYTNVYLKGNYTGKLGVYLSRQQILHIDDYIRDYNRAIRNAVNRRNAWHKKVYNREPYFIVDTCDMMQRVALSGADGRPLYDFPDYLNENYPGLNAKYYDVDAIGNLQEGGLFGLDGVHPSPIGQGLLAREFMRVMKNAGVSFKTPLDWESICESDSLLQHPISLIREVYSYDKLKTIFIKIMRYFV